MKDKTSRMTLYSILATSLLALIAFDLDAQTPGEPERLADHVILISIDGFRPEFYQDETLPAPMLQQMARDGSQADGVRGIFPSVTFASHTTLVTGLYPEGHGIFYNQPFMPEGQTGDWYWYYDALQSENLWSLADREGLTTASINWPVTVGAPIDYNIPDVWDPDREVIAAMRRYATPEGFLEELEENATGLLRDDMLSSQYNMSEDRRGAMASYIIKEYQPNLMTVHLVSTDSFQHRYGRDHDRVDRAIAAVDRAIARMVEALEEAGIVDRTAFVISGDHGFTNISQAVAPNTWLVEAGLMEDRSDRGNWRATFHTGGGSALLHLRDPDDEEAVELVRELIDNQPGSVQRRFRIVEREELDEIGADPAAPLALAAEPGVTFSGATSGETLRAASGGTHGHFPDFDHMNTGFVAWGSGIHDHAHPELIGMEDIAPLVAALLGLELGDVDGVLIPGLLQQE